MAGALRLRAPWGVCFALAPGAGHSAGLQLRGVLARAQRVVSLQRPGEAVARLGVAAGPLRAARDAGGALVPATRAPGPVKSFAELVGNFFVSRASLVSRVSGVSPICLSSSHSDR